METAKNNKNLSSYIGSLLMALTEYRKRENNSLADHAHIYTRIVQTACRLEAIITKEADLELQEVKPAVTMGVTEAALDLAARAARHYYIEQDYNAAESAGLEDE